MNKQRTHLLVLIISALLVVSSCSDSQSSDIRSMEKLKGDTDEKISLVITDIDNKNCSAELAVVNHTGNSVCYGESFYIQRRSGNGWTEVDHLQKDECWNTVLFISEPQKGPKWTIHWKLRYGELENGQYRIVKDYYYGDRYGTDKNKIGYCICEFEINDIADNTPVGWGTSDGPEQAAKEYYKNTVFKLADSNATVKLSEKEHVILVFKLTKGGDPVEPDRSIELRYDGSSWKVENEGY